MLHIYTIIELLVHLRLKKLNCISFLKDLGGIITEIVLKSCTHDPNDSPLSPHKCNKKEKGWTAKLMKIKPYVIVKV